MLNSLRTGFCFFLLFASHLITPQVSAEFVVPSAPDGYVLDQADILSSQTEQDLNTKSALLQEETSTQIALVTIPSLEGYPIETVSLDIARSWGVGQNKHNNGILVVIAPNDREVRIEVGYGMEGVVTDAESSFIIRNLMIPSMRDEDYDTASLLAFERLDGLARQEIFPEVDDGGSSSGLETIFIIVWVLIFFGGILGSILSGTKSWWLGGVIGGIAGAFVWTWAGLLIGLALGLGADYILSTYFYKKFGMVDSSGRSVWRSGGGGFGGSSGGGFGGFGGGGFGGGGASGKW